MVSLTRLSPLLPNLRTFTNVYSPICSGGGVGGLVLAVALSAHPDIQVDVYEAAHQFAEIGAGIGMWPRVWKIMQALGLQDDLSRIAVIPPDDEPRELDVFRIVWK